MQVLPPHSGWPSVDEKELVKVLFEYGEERFARRIARAIVERRVETPITTTRELAKLIEDVVPVKEKHKHPATRSFQAIRIEINSELDELKAVLQQSARDFETRRTLGGYFFPFIGRSNRQALYQG